jgi:hypothetical protein
MLEGEVRWFGKRLDTQFTQLRIVPISDLHYGNPLCSLKHFQFTIDFILKYDDVFTYLNGDLIEAVIIGSKGDVFKQKCTPQKQRDDVIDLLKPIKHKILGMTTGNHEARVYRATSMDVSQDIANALGIPYRADGMVLKVMFGKGNSWHDDKPYVFWGYTTHGYGGARTKSAKAVKVERAAAWMPSADFVTMSHDHVVNVSPDVDLIPDNRGMDFENGFLSGKVTAHRKELIKTNAYLKWGGYAESGGFPPSDLATPVICLLTPQSELWNTIPGEHKKAVRVIA